jgi:hypothetical protein
VTILKDETVRRARHARRAARWSSARWLSLSPDCRSLFVEALNKAKSIDPDSIPTMRAASTI